MPELPEVDTVARGLVCLVAPPARITATRLARRDLRRPVPAALPNVLIGARLLAIRRRAKYLCWDTDRGLLLNHLGMTGSWRVDDGQPRPHDHFHLRLDNGRSLVFADPRRFGLLEWAPGTNVHPLLADLGPEPFDPAFDGPALHARLRGRSTAIKPLLLDQRLVAGVGNIYASEACWHARLQPTTPAGRLSARRCGRLVEALRSVLAAAIAAGGSTISDFRQAGGSEGHFQHAFVVYGRAGEPCPACAQPIQLATLGGRSTFWCRRCQR